MRHQCFVWRAAQAAHGDSHKPRLEWWSRRGSETRRKPELAQASVEHSAYLFLWLC